MLSTVFISVSKGCIVQAPHSVLNGKVRSCTCVIAHVLNSSQYIANIRRSPQMSEPFTMEVSYATTFEQIEKLRDQMLAYVKDQRRDYMGQFDVSIVGEFACRVLCGQSID